jgi:hypothetical protein
MRDMIQLSTTREHIGRYRLISHRDRHLLICEFPLFSLIIGVSPALEHKQVPVGLDEFTIITHGLVVLNLQAAFRVVGIRCSIY